MYGLELARGRLIAALAVMLLVCLVGALSSCGGPAQAQAVSDTVSWTMPTTRVDGSALPASDIAKATVSWGASASGPFNLGSIDVTAPATSAVIPRAGSGVGTVCYVVTVTTKATAPGGALTGPPSSPAACKTIAAQPSAPTGVSVN